MGGNSSKALVELETSQALVKRLTSDLQKASISLAAQSSKLDGAQKEAAKLRDQAGQLQSVRDEVKELNRALSSTKREAHDVPHLKDALKKAQQADAERQAKAAALQAELKASKEELERVFGELKFAEQEKLHVGRLRTDLTDAQRTLQAKSQEMEALNARLVTDANAALAVEGKPLEHPVFGELLHDYGHKRLYRASPLTLWAGTLVWDRQRAFRQERAATIATAKAKSSVDGWPGSISVVETADDPDATGGGGGGGGGASAGTVLGAVIDGQHRLGAAHLLSQRGKLSAPLQDILVEVYPAMSDKKIGEIFTEINRAEPVTLVDLPEGGATPQANAVLTEAAERLRERHPAMFKHSHGCRAPHLNVDVLRNEMYKADLVGRHGFTSADALLAWLDARNDELATREQGEWSVQGSRVSSRDALSNAMGKAKEQRLFLGLTWEWLQHEPRK